MVLEGEQSSGSRLPAAWSRFLSTCREALEKQPSHHWQKQQLQPQREHRGMTEVTPPACKPRLQTWALPTAAPVLELRQLWGEGSPSPPPTRTGATLCPF